MIRKEFELCVRHLHENFKRAGFRAQTYKDALWEAATSTTSQYFKDGMEEMKKLDLSAYEWFNDKDPAQWSRAYFTLTAKCDVLLNNMCVVFNSFILDARDKPILTLVAMVKDLIMVRLCMNREKAAKWDGKLCPKPREKLLKCVKEASACMPMKSDRTHFQVFSGSTSNQCAVDLEKRTCSCRKWQLTGIPCKHACASIRMNEEDVIDYVDQCYYVETYKKVYAPAILPMAGPELWPQTGRVGPLPPPLMNKKAGRTKRLRRVNPIESDYAGKTMKCKVRKYICKTCHEQGHNSRNCKKKNSTRVQTNEQPQPFSQESIPETYAFGSQNSAQSVAVVAAPVQLPRAAPSSNRSHARGNVTMAGSVRRPVGVAIRAPPPMSGNSMHHMAPFRPPARSMLRPPIIFFNQGKNFARMDDLQR